MRYRHSVVSEYSVHRSTVVNYQIETNWVEETRSRRYGLA